MQSSDRSKIKRAPKRALYNEQEVFEILDAHFMCHVGFIHHGKPVVIPTMYGRKGNSLFIHGASVSRLVCELEKGIDVSISVAQVNGLVLARSAFHHSLNYESVVVFGTGTPVAESEKEVALKIISDHMLPQRWEEVRQPNAKELKATKVIEIKIEEASGKRRTGGPNDDKEDYELDVWAGVLPLNHSYGEPIADEKLKSDIPPSPSIS
jgi:nitroimidazol reductase NimA-like FMN-containing flavoprotein (pyridoxamine 5'-phosphate oxidase superfamily)